jgi:heterodisulfide reductase subunit A
MASPRIGVYICNCGTNIAKVVDCDAVCTFAAEQPGVAVARTYRYMCSNPGQEMIADDIRQHQLERVVVAACSPRMHERTFRRAIAAAGLNPYFAEMANIREQCSWVHEDGAAATEKAKALSLSAIRRVVHHEPLEMSSVEMCPTTLVIGGGIAGLCAALDIAWI